MSNSATATPTPGPWTDHDVAGVADGYVWGDGEIVCATGESPRGLADARLIAAAPELLAVLKEAIDRNVVVEGPDWWGRVHAIVAKVEG